MDTLAPILNLWAILSRSGFVVLQNLYTLPETFLEGNPVPRSTIIHDPEVFGEGACIVGGVDGCEVNLLDDDG